MRNTTKSKPIFFFFLYLNVLKLYCRHCNLSNSFLEFFKKKFLQVFSLFNLENIFLLVFMLTLLITAKWKKKTRLFQPLQTRSIPSSPFCTRVLQTIQALKAKSNPKQAHSKCNSNSSSSITNKNIQYIFLRHYV